MSDKSKTILFVCAGNTCRSPFAQGLFNRMALEQRIEYTALSAGLSAFAGDTANQKSLAAAGEYGFDLSGHRSAGVNGEIMKAAFRVYAMEKLQVDILKALYPEHESKIFTLAREDIADPFGQGDQSYFLMAAQIESALKDIISALGGKK